MSIILGSFTLEHYCLQSREPHKCLSDSLKEGVSVNHQYSQFTKQLPWIKGAILLM